MINTELMNGKHRTWESFLKDMVWSNDSIKYHVVKIHDNHCTKCIPWGIFCHILPTISQRINLMSQSRHFASHSKTGETMSLFLLRPSKTRGKRCREEEKWVGGKACAEARESIGLVAMLSGVGPRCPHPPPTPHHNPRVPHPLPNIYLTSPPSLKSQYLNSVRLLTENTWNYSISYPE